MSVRTREWLREFLSLGARRLSDGIPTRDVERQEDTVLRALEVLDEKPGVLIADEVGMGKTYEALGVVAAVRSTNPKSRVLVLTPGPDLNTKWRSEFARCGDKTSRIYDFGDEYQAVRTLDELVEVAKQKRIVIAPVSAFNSTRGGYDQAYVLSLYFEWKGLHGQTVNAVLRRFREGKLERVDVASRKFLDVVPYEKLLPHLDEAFRVSRDTEHEPLDVLYEQRGGYDAFTDSEPVRRAIDIARFRLVRALLPDFDLLVLDEAHKLKNADTVRSQAVNAVFRRKFGKALFLTATPFQLDIGELRQVFAMFSLAKGAPSDLMDQADALFADIRTYQQAYEAFQQVWGQLDAGAAAEFREVYERDPDLTSPIADPTLRVVGDRVRTLLALKRTAIEPKFRTWMIRSLREDKRTYRTHHRRKLQPQGSAVLPFLIYERFIAELFRRSDGTHKAAVEINMVSSYGAARTGALLDEEARKLPAEADGYRGLLRRLLDGLRQHSVEHPKMSYVLTDALAAAERGEKTLIFCARTETLKQMARDLTREWEEHVLVRWQKAFPGKTGEEIFDSSDAGERSQGIHSRLRSRLHRPQDALYLALRERYLQSLLHMSTWGQENAEVIVSGARDVLRSARTNATSADRLDYRLMKRCVEHAAAKLWREREPDEAAVNAQQVGWLCDPRYIPFGLDLKKDDLEGDEEGDLPAAWTISEDAAALVLDSRPHLWAYLSAHLEMLSADLRVRVVESVARFLTFKEVPFLADVLTAAKEEGLDVEHIESRELLRFIDAFWMKPAGRPWFEQVRRFVEYFAARDAETQEFILTEAIRTGNLVRQTSEGESREKLREAFNTPLYPMVLLANEVMQEGLDLHRNCRRIVHHDLAWNPAQLEQRVGRIDRLGSLTLRLREKDQGATLDILYPLIQRTIDDRLYRTVKNREKWLEFLLGARPDFAEYGLGDNPLPELPATLAASLTIDLQPGNVRAGS